VENVTIKFQLICIGRSIFRRGLNIKVIFIYTTKFMLEMTHKIKKRSEHSNKKIYFSTIHRKKSWI